MLLTIITVLLLIVEVLCGFLLVVAVLLQRSKGQGAAAGLAFGAGMGETLFGAQAGNVLTRATAVLLAIFLVNTTLLAVIGARTQRRQTSVTDRLEGSAPVPVEMPMQAPMSPGVPSAEIPMAPAALPAAELPAGGGVVGEPVRIDTPLTPPAGAATPGGDAGKEE